MMKSLALINVVLLFGLAGMGAASPSGRHNLKEAKTWVTTGYAKWKTEQQAIKAEEARRAAEVARVKKAEAEAWARQAASRPSVSHRPTQTDSTAHSRPEGSTDSSSSYSREDDPSPPAPTPGAGGGTALELARQAEALIHKAQATSGNAEKNRLLEEAVQILLKARGKTSDPSLNQQINMKIKLARSLKTL